MMMMMESKELSLVAQFDDICRHPLFTFQDADLIKFIEKEKDIRAHLRQNSHATEALQSELKKANKDKRALELTLAQVRRDLEEEMFERKRIQTDFDQLARQMQIIKELVGNKENQSYHLLSQQDRDKLAFLNNSNFDGGASPSMMDTALLDESPSLLSESEYDKTGDDIISSGNRRRRSKRKSRQSHTRTGSYTTPRHVLGEATLSRYPVQPSAPTDSDDKTSPKRRRLLGGETETSTDTTDDSSLKVLPQSEVKLRRSSRQRMNRSLSAGAKIDDDDTDSFHGINPGVRLPLDDTQVPRSILKKGLAESPSSSTPQSPTIKRWASASKLQRQHHFVNKNVLRSDSCSPCGKKIKFNHRAVKCKDCKLVCHMECKERLSQLCIPIDATPCKGTQGNRICDFSPADPPYVPAIILHCINEVESRGFNEEGIYRKSGMEKEVKELKDKFMRGKGPRLDSITDIHVVCGCLKDFLRNLKEPLIPTSLWTTFVNAAHITDDHKRSRAVGGAVKQLPAVNKDTIAFLVLHLQRVSERPDTRMTIDNLAKVFGPTIVGYSVQTPEPMQMIAETRPQQDVMTSLLEHSSDYWAKILSGDHSQEVLSTDVEYLDTPEMNRPISSSDGDSLPPVKSAAKVRKFFGESPRPENLHQNRPFFPSPMLK